MAPALSLRPEDRYPSAAALRDDVGRWLDDEPVSALREGLPAGVWRWCRRHPKVLAWSAALGMADVLLVNSVAGRLAASTASNHRIMYSYFTLLQQLVTTPVVGLLLGAQAAALLGAAVGAAVGVSRRGVGISRGVSRGVDVGLRFGALGGLLLAVVASAYLLAVRGPSDLLAHTADPQGRYRMDPSAVASDAGALSKFFLISPEPAWRDPVLASRLAHKAVDLAPEDARNWEVLRAASYRTGDWATCIAATEHLLGSGSAGNEVYYLDLAVSYWERGEKARALGWYERSQQPGVRIDHDDEDYRRLRARAEALFGRPSGAEAGKG